MIDVALGIGHLGGTGGRQPARHGVLREDAVSLRTATACALALMEGGYSVAICGYDKYAARQDWAKWNARVYVDIHANAFDPANSTPDLNQYGLVFYDIAAPEGEGLGDHIADALERSWPGVLTDARVRESRPFDWTKHANYLIKFIAGGRCVGAVLEPGFLNNVAHSPMWQADGPERTGVALAGALVRWLDERE